MDEDFKNLMKLVNKIREIASQYQFEVECDNVIKNVYLLRKFWKPKKIKLLLLAESHVWTTEEESKVKVIIENTMLGDDYPKHYSRFVYCLGYGENSLLNNEIQNNNGTPQFWKLFYGLFKDLSVQNNRNNINVLKSHVRNNQVRIQNKIKLLSKMKEKGGWLLDASPIALYRNNERACNDLYREVLHLSMDCYINRIIEREQPLNILVIGRSVFDILESKIKGSTLERITSWIYQPQAKLSREAHNKNFKKLYKIASNIING